MLNRKKLLKKLKHQKKVQQASGYIDELKRDAKLFRPFEPAEFLINNVLESNRLIQQGQLPQDLPELLLPNDIQDQVFRWVNQRYPQGNPRGDKIWDKFTEELPKLDERLRSYRDYLERTYGMWAYISAPFTADLAHFLNGQPALEVMAGNGYVSKGLRDHGANVFCTDSMAWKSQNQTGHHLVTKVEPLNAMDAFNKYKNKIKYIIMCWSPDGLTIDWQLLQAVRQSGLNIPMLVIGEKNGATNSKVFWKNAKYIDQKTAQKLNRHHQSFDLIHDQVYLVK